MYKIILSFFIFSFTDIFPGFNILRANKFQKPNVLFIMVDDLRDWTGYTSQFSNVKIPHLNSLAEKGMVFSNAYCAAPVCAPSRTALLTGISPAKTGVYENGQPWPSEIRKTITLTRHFMDEGYYVAGFGKIYHGQGDLQYWHHFIYGEYSPLPKKPDNFYALGNPLDIPDSLTGDGKRVNNAIKVLEQDIDVPLFLACGLVRPHTPWNVPRKYFDMYDPGSIQIPDIKKNDLNDIPPIGKKIAHRVHHDHYGKDLEWTHKSIVDSGLWKVNIRAYLASITFADAQIGRLLDAWFSSKYSKNGIVILMGDHGWHHGEKEHWSKRTLWEEGTKTPLIVYVPGITKPNSICKTPVSLLDIFPTLLDLRRLSKVKHLDGLSFTPLLNSPDVPWDKPAVTIWGQNNVSIRSLDWRYIHYCDETKELYFHPDDPHEWINRAGDKKNIRIINKLHRWVPKCTNSVPFKRNRKSWFETNNIVCE